MLSQTLIFHCGEELWLDNDRIDYVGFLFVVGLGVFLIARKLKRERTVLENSPKLKRLSALNAETKRKLSPSYDLTLQINIRCKSKADFDGTSLRHCLSRYIAMNYKTYTAIYDQVVHDREVYQSYTRRYEAKKRGRVGLRWAPITFPENNSWSWRRDCLRSIDCLPHSFGSMSERPIPPQRNAIFIMIKATSMRIRLSICAEHFTPMKRRKRHSVKNADVWPMTCATKSSSVTALDVRFAEELRLTGRFFILTIYFLSPRAAKQFHQIWEYYAQRAILAKATVMILTAWTKNDPKLLSILSIRNPSSYRKSTTRK